MPRPKRRELTLDEDLDRNSCLQKLDCQKTDAYYLLLCTSCWVQGCSGSGHIKSGGGFGFGGGGGKAWQIPFHQPINVDTIGCLWQDVATSARAVALFMTPPWITTRPKRFRRWTAKMRVRASEHGRWKKTIIIRFLPWRECVKTRSVDFTNVSSSTEIGEDR